MCIGFLVQYNYYNLPRWIWIIYNINSITYTIILSGIIISHALERDNETINLIFTSIGTLVFFIGGISGFIEENYYESVDLANGPDQNYLAGCMTGKFTIQTNFNRKIKM